MELISTTSTIATAVTTHPALPPLPAGDGAKSDAVKATNIAKRAYKPLLQVLKGINGK